MSEIKEKKEMIFNGIPASPGIAFGEAYVVNVDEFVVDEDRIPDDAVEEEIRKFREALSETESELLELYGKIKDEMGEEHAKILDTHRMILSDDVMIKETIHKIRKEKVSVAYAFSSVIDKTLKSFDRIKDGYLKERAEDIRDVKRRVLKNIFGQRIEGLDKLRKKVVVVAKSLTPSDTAGMKKKYVEAIVTDRGGSTSHAAIIARSHGIPAVVGLDDFTRFVRPRDLLIVDGLTGQVILRPSVETVKVYKEARTKFIEMEKELLNLKDYPAVTLDGKTIELSANIEAADELDEVLDHGARGIGLFRTEYFFITRQNLPSEEEQYRYYSSVVKRLSPDPVIIRTLDVGGDKIARWAKDFHESNPFMGWRGIRFTLTRKDIFRTQLRAIYRAAAHGSVKIMFPMISVYDEVIAAKAICREVKEDLMKERYQVGDDVEIGIMIETPSSVAIADHLAKEVDFFSIGTNDLIQYTLAVDRGNSRISYLYDALHPSILRMIRDVVSAAHKNGIWVGVCGEMPASIHGSLLLLGLDIDEFSASSYLIPEIKKIVRSVTFDETRALAKKALQMKNATEVRELIEKFIREKRPELKEFVPEASK